ncbi:hypothetical protein F4779DRAFT_123627 [Xylariaceae sp. FL0662B]|nr:hypothetical protein F4779DRAFT_123627 [Xylariaceae sp. FL0662B]
MKLTQVLFSLLALTGATLAAPAAAESNTNGITSASALFQRDVDWVGDGIGEDSVTAKLEARAKGRGERCTPGKGQCGSGLGCYGCLGHKPVCQEGPGSNQCCFEDDRGRRCEIIPNGK